MNGNQTFSFVQAFRKSVLCALRKTCMYLCNGNCTAILEVRVVISLPWESRWFLAQSNFFHISLSLLFDIPGGLTFPSFVFPRLLSRHSFWVLEMRRWCSPFSAHDRSWPSLLAYFVSSAYKIANRSQHSRACHRAWDLTFLWRPLCVTKFTLQKKACPERNWNLTMGGHYSFCPSVGLSVMSPNIHSLSVFIIVK